MTNNTEVKLSKVLADTIKVRFVGESVRRPTSKAYEREILALEYFTKKRSAKKGLPTLAELIEKTGYGVEDAKWDIARGRIEIVGQ